MQQQSGNSAGQNGDELRNTLKKCPPKITGGHKLPEAFSNINLMKKNKNQLSSLNGKVGFNQFNKPEVAPQKNIDNMIEQQEYKAVQNLLQPINANDDRKSPPPVDRDPLLSEGGRKKEVGGQGPSIQAAGHNLKNPLAPLKNYMLNMQYLQENFKEFSEISKEKLQMIEASKHTQLYQSRIKLEEMITLGLMKGSRDSGAVKKMLHAPTLRLYAVKEEPVSTKEVRHCLRDWAVFWQNKLHDTGLHTKLYGTFWNTPEGCVSILTEFMSGGSLQNVLESFGTLPEGAIKALFPMIISGIEEIHNLSTYCFGSLSPSQVLFKQDGSLKLSLGISYRISQHVNSFFSSMQFPGKPNERISLYDPCCFQSPNIFKNSGNSSEKSASQKEQVQKSDDVFRLGFLALVCAIGSFDVIENSSHILECIQLLLEDQNRPEPLYKACCLIHSEDLITQLITEKLEAQKGGTAAPITNNSKQKQKKIQGVQISDLLGSSRFSKEFISFLCLTLKFNYQKRSTFANIKQHPFFSIPNQKGLPININDLLRISQEWNRQESLPSEYQGASEQQLERVCSAMLLVLPNCEKWFKQQNYTEYTKHLKQQLTKDSPYIKALARDLGLDSRLVASKINQVYQSFSFVTSKKQSNQITQQQVSSKPFDVQQPNLNFYHYSSQQQNYHSNQLAEAGNISVPI